MSNLVSFFNVALIRQSTHRNHIHPFNESSLIIYSPLCRWMGGWSVWIHKHFWALRGKQCCSQIQFNLRNYWPVFRCKKSTEKKKTCLHTARVVSYECPEAATFKLNLKRGGLHHVFSLNVRWYLATGFIQEPSEMLTSASLATSGGHLGLKHGGKWPRFQVEYECRGLQTLWWHRPKVWRHAMFLLLFYYVWT